MGWGQGGVTGSDPSRQRGQTPRIDGARSTTGSARGLTPFLLGEGSDPISPRFSRRRFLLCSAPMDPVIAKLKRTRLFGQLTEEAIADLIAVPGVESGAAGEPVITEPGDLVVLLEGGLAMTSHDDAGEHVAQFGIDDNTHDPVILYTIPAGARLVLTQPSVYVLIDGERLDGMLAGKQEVKSIGALDEGVRERIASLMNAQLFKHMPFEHLVRCAEAMQETEVANGEDVVSQGGPGDYFYVIKS